MEQEEKIKIAKIAEEAAKIIKDNPELKYFEAIKRAKAMHKES